MSSVGLPNDWSEQPLSELVAHFQSGVSVNSDENYGTAEYWILKTSCVNGGKFNPLESKPIPPSDVHRAELHPKANSILVSRMNTFALVGETAYVPEDVPWAFVPDRLWQTVMEQGKDTHVRWLSFVLQSPSFRQQVSNSATGTSGSMKNISQSLYLGIDVRTPPPKEQRKIARILTTLDNLIEKTEALIAKYQSIKQGMMHDLFTRGVDAHGRLRPTHEQAPDLYKQSELGWIPKEWDDQKSLGENIDFITDYRGKTPPTSNEGIPVISAETVGDGYLKDTTKRVSEQTYRAWTTRGFPEPGDVIFTTEAPVGAIAALPADQTYLLTRRVIALRPYEDNLKKRYLHWRMILEGQSSTWLKYQHGSTVPRILKPDLLNHTFPLPNPEEQVEVGTRLDACQSKIDSERAALAKYKLQKSGLMQDLLTGKVRVNVE